jgi:hypothetical protein
VQNIPEQPGGGQVEGDFVKLEIVLVRGPLSEDLEAKEQLVEVHAEKATLRTTVVSPGQSLRLSLALEKEDVFYILAGYADLSSEDQVSLEEYRALLLAMMASFALE